MFRSNIIGAMYESSETSSTIKQRITAITTYIAISESDSFLVSNTVAVIPLILQ